MPNAIEIKNLRKDYEGFSLKNISFVLPAGHIMGFVGQNGAGKTTTIRSILNMAHRSSGEIKVLGLDNISQEQEIKQNIGVVFDETFFVEGWKISDVENVVKGFYSNWDKNIFRQHLNDFGLLSNKKVGDLSRGMKLKLMLSVALSHNAKLLIFDEPTSGIDPVARDELLEILGNYVSGGERSIFFSTHITTDLEKVADYISLIDKGTLFYTGTKDELLKKYKLVSGPMGSLTEELKAKVIGLSTLVSEFHGLVPAEELQNLPTNISSHQPTIDEILIHISKIK